MAKPLNVDHEPIELRGTVRHGTTGGYAYGCKCSECMRAQREYANAYYHKRQDRKKAEAAKKAVQAEAARQRAADKQAAREAEELERLHHGTTARYAYGCRCAPCTEAAQKHDAKVQAHVAAALVGLREHDRKETERGRDAQ